MILVEGPDGAGKTVLIGQLSRAFSELRMVPDVHETKGEKEKQKEERRIKSVRARTYRALSEAFRGTHPLVHDRLFFSELVYGPQLRGESQFSDTELKFILRSLETLWCPIIFCLPPYTVVEHNVHNTKDHLEGVNENIEALYGGYLDWSAMLSKADSFNFIGYDYTRGADWAYLSSEVAKYLEARKVREA